MNKYEVLFVLSEKAPTMEIKDAMYLADSVGEMDSEMLIDRRALLVLSTVLFAENGVIKDKYKELKDSRPAVEKAIDRLLLHHASLKCGPFPGSKEVFLTQCDKKLDYKRGLL